MGAAIGTVRSQIKGDENEKTVALERLKMLVKMAKEHLMLVEQNILSGRQGDQQIHAGTVIELERYYSVDAQENSEIGDEAGKMIESFVSGEVMDGVKTILTRGANILFGSKSAGESEYSQMLILWEYNTLVRIDVYHWKYQFTSNEIMNCVESIYAAFAMKRVVDVAKVRSAVLVYSISRAADTYEEDIDVNKIVKKALELHKEAKQIKAQYAPSPAVTNFKTSN
jgi:hypothetical protein